MSQKNFVSLKDETIQIFKNPFLDWVSKIHWSFPLIVWVPVLLYCLYLSYSLGFEWTKIILYFLIGFFLWTISEYVLHRFVFHYHPSSAFGQRLHFLMHGVHHDYPNDSKRLVMPPLMSIIISIPFFAAFYYGFGQGAASFSAFSGLIFGYLCYDMLHYAVHHAKWKNQYFENLKKHHMAHHFVHPDAGYGVSSMFWDKIFHTTIEEKRNQEN